MKKYLLLFALFLGNGIAVLAQDIQPGDEVKRQERIKSLYIDYITQQLQLNPDEAQIFWPIHSKFETDLKGVKPEMPELEKQQAILKLLPPQILPAMWKPVLNI